MARRRGTERERLLAAVCYATRGRGEVLWQGRKLVGLAQRRRRHGAMVQCGMLRHWAPQHLLTSLGADSDDSEILRAAVGLAEVLPEPPDDAQIMASVESAFGV
jgi:lipoate-protein ligase A